MTCLSNSLIKLMIKKSFGIKKRVNNHCLNKTNTNNKAQQKGNNRKMMNLKKKFMKGMNKSKFNSKAQCNRKFLNHPKKLNKQRIKRIVLNLIQLWAILSSKKLKIRLKESDHLKAELKKKKLFIKVNRKIKKM